MIPDNSFALSAIVLENHPAIGIEKTEYKLKRKGQEQIKLYCGKV